MPEYSTVNYKDLLGTTDESNCSIIRTLDEQACIKISNHKSNINMDRKEIITGSSFRKCNKQFQDPKSENIGNKLKNFKESIILQKSGLEQQKKMHEILSNSNILMETSTTVTSRLIKDKISNNDESDSDESDDEIVKGFSATSSGRTLFDMLMDKVSNDYEPFKDKTGNDSIMCFKETSRTKNSPNVIGKVQSKGRLKADVSDELIGAFHPIHCSFDNFIE
ncbi:hypothetical protein CDAR_569651 [Caerostris darwini]|uniref:Uncharacterized protein n=1 Tax=Caerostris darwini TaxID=1538125 RepID=A0AAV4RZ20_9ARAC|nr:hypothetical protein CDAR_569651 [Caerostris darwini]